MIDITIRIEQKGDKVNIQTLTPETEALHLERDIAERIMKAIDGIVNTPGFKVNSSVVCKNIPNGKEIVDSEVKRLGFQPIP